MTTNPTRSAVEATVAGNVDASSEAVRARIKALETDYAADGAGFDAKLLTALLTRAESAEAERDEAKRDAVNQGALKEKAIYKMCQLRTDLATARAERDEARVQSKRAGEIGLAKWKEGIDRAATARAELAAAGETIAAVTKQREDADHDADLARSQLGSVAMDNADLRATIARLTAEVQAARKTTTFIETADGVYAVSIGTPKFCLLAKDYASAKERANEAREFAARARTNPKEPTT